MLQIQNIQKKYVTGDFVQKALDGVSLNLRDNEFVAVLGPSGSGKTTLLNMIGGLDRYDSGDLIINGISTKKYKDRDWDSYRNHTIGFVFQSYNLIPHQSILSNVELALTISGVSRSERRNRAKEALDKVGLQGQYHKRPNQMSGGQMQRVAIARALINDPEILLADEPTGALDSETSLQVMELLKEVAKDRLVVMVTHNPELAKQYATRIVELKDGRITADSAPYEVKQAETSVKHENMGKASMSPLTALSLSFNNLRTKKGRTLMTSFAGSLGIIGIALIVALSNGVNTYINDIQKDTMTSYPITLEAKAMDMSSMLSSAPAVGANNEINHELDAVYSNGKNIEMASGMTSSITENNLTNFKKYLDDETSEIHEYIGENGILYSYNTKFGVYAYDTEGVFINTSDESSKSSSNNPADMMLQGAPNPADMPNMFGAGDSGGNSNFEELLPGQEGASSVNGVIMDSYEVLYGQWPSSYDEVVLVLDKNNEISTTVLYQLGLLPYSEYQELLEKLDAGDEVSVEAKSWSYSDICNQTFYMIPACDTYEKNKDGTYSLITDDAEKMEALAENAVKLKIAGVIRPLEDANNASISAPIAYMKALTDYVIDYTNNSEVVKAQQESQDVNILNGMTFKPADDETKIADAIAYLSGLGVSDKASIAKNVLTKQAETDPQSAAQLAAMTEEQLAAMLDDYLKNPEDERMLHVYDIYISSGSYEDNMEAFGVVSLDAPSAISIYADSFEAKDSITACIESYNTTASEEDQITYTDYVGLLMSSVTTIINVITYVLIAFVAISLIVSSIMIGIITYISVLERTKEIGILRAIGASKRNISQVFNAETLIVGLCAGAIGIGITLLLLIPTNSIIHTVIGTTSVNAVLPVEAGIILVVLSVLLTLIGGLIPAKKAARKDPVTALRTE